MKNFTLQDIYKLSDKIKALKEAFNIEKQHIIVDELTMKSADPNFWVNFDEATRILKELKEAENKIESINFLERSINMLLDDYEDSKEIESEDIDNYLNISFSELYNNFSEYLKLRQT